MKQTIHADQAQALPATIAQITGRLKALMPAEIKDQGNDAHSILDIVTAILNEYGSIQQPVRHGSLSRQAWASMIGSLEEMLKDPEMDRCLAWYCLGQLQAMLGMLTKRNRRPMLVRLFD